MSEEKKKKEHDDDSFSRAAKVFICAIWGFFTAIIPIMFVECIPELASKNTPYSVWILVIGIGIVLFCIGGYLTVS